MDILVNTCCIIFSQFVESSLLFFWLHYLYKENISELAFPDNLKDGVKVPWGKWEIVFLLVLPLLMLWCLWILWMPQLVDMLGAQLLASFMGAVAVSDMRQQIIFDKQLVLLSVLGLTGVMAGGYLPGDYLAASLIGGMVFLILAVMTRGGIGGGDIKLVVALGLWLGTGRLLAACMLGIIAGGLGAALLLLTKKIGRKEYFPYGPYFAVAAMIVYVLMYEAA